MENSKPYLTFSHPGPGPASFLYKKAAEKNAERLRSVTLRENREAKEVLADVRQISPGIHVLPADADGVACEWIYSAYSPPDKTIIYLHGGGWCTGSLHTARAVGKMICGVSGLRVLTVAYRLAPEFPYPLALDDCARVYRWLALRGFPAEGIMLFGDSAGGNLALALMHRLRAENLPLPAALGLASPVPDMTEHSALARGGDDLLYTRLDGVEQNMMDLYCAGHDRCDPQISPVYGELSFFPPMLIHVGQDEDLCVDCNRFAAKAYESGCDVQLKIWRGMFHDFSVVGATLKESWRSLHDFGAYFLRCAQEENAITEAPPEK